MAKIPFYKAKKYTGKEAAKPHVLYDMSIDDVTERQEKALMFSSARACAEYLGLRFPAWLANYTSFEAIKKKKRFYSTKHKKYFSIRAVSKP